MKRQKSIDAKALVKMTELYNTGICILAGGLARRMGGKDKPLLEIAGKTMISHILKTIHKQTKGPIVLNVNGDPARFAPYNLPIVEDIVPDFAGPLAGILTGLDWINSHPQKPDYMLSLPGDAPLIPGDLLNKLSTAMIDTKSEIVSVSSNNRTHPVIALWCLSLLEPLRQGVVENDIRKIDLWTENRKIVYVEWDTIPYDPFYNVNRIEDLDYAESILLEKHARN